MNNKINDIIIENAKIIFKNFKGEETKMNRKGDRNFCIVIEDPSMAKKLIEDGWNIKQFKQKDPDEVPDFYLPVSIRFDVRPPKVVLVTRKNKTLLDEESIEALDYGIIKSADIVINPYPWDANGKHGIKAYLKTMYVVLEEDAFESKYETFAGE